MDGSWIDIQQEKPEQQALVNILTADGLINTAKRVKDRSDGVPLFRGGQRMYSDVMYWAYIQVRPSHFQQPAFAHLLRVAA